MGVWPRVTPDMPAEAQPSIGLIGMGAMGSLYARSFSEAGWKKIYICDQPAKYEALKEKWEGVPGIHVCPDGHRVSRVSDYILYSVEAEFIDRVVAQYGLSTKVGAIVAGQTSVKEPERIAFEKYLPEDVHIVSCHSLHGPNVSTVGQPLVIINHRGSADAVTLVEHILAPLRSRYVYLSYKEHDIVTANTQAVTHAAFLRQATSDFSSSTPHRDLHAYSPTATSPSSTDSPPSTPSTPSTPSSPSSTSSASLASPMTPVTPSDSMGTAWHCSLSYPWEHGLYVGGIETVKVNIMLRIYSNKWHVYAGLAILNPSARVQIDQFARSTTEIFKLMLAGDAAGLRARIYDARAKVFGGSLDLGTNGGIHENGNGHANGHTNGHTNGDGNGNGKTRTPIFLSEDILDRFSLGKKPSSALSPTTSSRSAPPNSHLSLLAMVDCWAALSIKPFEHLDLAATPIFRMWIGVAEYLFRSEARLDAAIHAALFDTSHRSDDLEFVVAARGWSQCISFGNFELYKERFMHTAGFFESRFEEATKVGSAMIQALMDSSTEPTKA
ncbi:Prephenate dehydrogenase [Earliella scabrosa]|nr:Prephenate dehydrogenase [Earliella scabrosa]